MFDMQILMGLFEMLSGHNYVCSMHFPMKPQSSPSLNLGCNHGYNNSNADNTNKNNRNNNG